MNEKSKLLNKRIGAIVKKLRKSRGYTQMKFAKILNIGVSTMSHYEQGTSQIPLNILISIADHFDVSVDYIIGRTNNKEVYSELDKIVIDDLNEYQILNIISKLSRKNQNIIKEVLLLMDE